MKTSDHSVLRLTTCLPLIIAGLVWLSLHFLGCQTLVTTNRPPSPNRVEGMLYYLPIGKITIKGDYGKGESTSRMKSDSASSTASPTATPTATPGPLTITVTAEVEADETAGVYYVTSIPNYMFEDDVHVTVNQKHLLSAGNVTTEDKTAEIVAAVASLVAGRTFVQRAEEKLTRVAFVKKVRNVGFNDGMLTDFQQHLPSPVLGFLGIPKAIIQAMVPIPAATDAGSGSTSGTNFPKKRLQSHFRGSQDSA